MRFFLVVLVLVGVMYQQSEAAVHIEVLEENKDHPGKCYRKEENKAYDVGSTWLVPGACEESTCSKEKDGKYVIDSRGCGSVGTSPPCKVVRDITLPYPDCCPKVECPGARPQKS